MEFPGFFREFSVFFRECPGIDVIVREKPGKILKKTGKIPETPRKMSKKLVPDTIAHSRTLTLGS